MERERSDCLRERERERGVWAIIWAIIHSGTLIQQLHVLYTYVFSRSAAARCTSVPAHVKVCALTVCPRDTSYAYMGHQITFLGDGGLTRRQRVWCVRLTDQRGYV